jgi:hypothetical protein
MILLLTHPCGVECSQDTCGETYRFSLGGVERGRIQIDREVRGRTALAEIRGGVAAGIAFPRIASVNGPADTCSRDVG